MVVELRELRAELPAVGRDVVNLDGTDGQPSRRIATEEVKLAVQFGDRQLGVGLDQSAACSPFTSVDLGRRGWCGRWGWRGWWRGWCRGRYRLRLARPSACGKQQSHYRNHGFHWNSPGAVHRFDAHRSSRHFPNYVYQFGVRLVKTPEALLEFPYHASSGHVIGRS